MLKPFRCASLLLLCALHANSLYAQAPKYKSPPRLHHVGLNSLDPEKAIEWYLRLWPKAERTVVAGQPAVDGEPLLLLFNKVNRPPPGAWRDDVHRAVPQSAFWHIGIFTNTTDIAARLKPLGITHLPLFVSPSDTNTVWRSGLAPYAGTLTAKQIPTAAAAAPRAGGFSYIVAPDGVLFELTGGPDTKDSFSHIHFLREHPLCTANWYAEYLGMELPPLRDSGGKESARAPYKPCEAEYGEAGWPSLEKIGTIRQPSASVRYMNGSMSWYPRQCVRDRCQGEARLVPSRGQALDHIAFIVDDINETLVRLRAGRVKILRQPYAFGTTRAVMIEDPDGLAIELIEALIVTPAYTKTSR
jgi:catechol 2,3-dioxygenase-like lactoylglutathione lyase family enzyme